MRDNIKIKSIDFFYVVDDNYRKFFNFLLLLKYANFNISRDKCRFIIFYLLVILHVQH